MKSTLSSSILQTDLGRAAAQHDHVSDQPVHLFVRVDRETMLMAATTLSDTGTFGGTSFFRMLHNHDLFYSEESDLIIVEASNIQEQF